MFLLVPNGAQLQVAFVDAEGGFGLGELHVGVPEFRRLPTTRRNVRSQQVAAFTQRRPVQPGLAWAPPQLGAAVGARLYLHLERALSAGVAAQQFADALSDADRILLAGGTTARGRATRPLEAPPHPP